MPRGCYSSKLKQSQSAQDSCGASCTRAQCRPGSEKFTTRQSCPGNEATRSHPRYLDGGLNWKFRSQHPSIYSWTLLQSWLSARQLATSSFKAPSCGLVARKVKCQAGEEFLLQAGTSPHRQVLVMVVMLVVVVVVVVSGRLDLFDLACTAAFETSPSCRPNQSECGNEIATLRLRIAKQYSWNIIDLL